VKKATWLTSAIFECRDCDKAFDNYKNAQALAAKHAKKYSHFVSGEIVLHSEYDGRNNHV